MKKINKFLSSLIVLTFLLSITINVNSNQDYIIKNKYDSIKLSYSFSKPLIETIVIENEIVNRISIDGLEKCDIYFKRSYFR